MGKAVNSWNEWDSLKRVILGRPEGTNIPAPEPAWQHDLPDGGYPLGSYGPMPEESVAAANTQMDNFVAIMQERGVEVDRVEVQPFMFNKPVATPDWTQLNCYGTNNSRDVHLVLGNYIIEATTSRRSRFYEYLNFRPILEKYFKEDPNFVHFAAPKPRLTEESYVENYYYLFNNVWSQEEKEKRLYRGEFHLTEKEPLWDAADLIRFGKDVFVQLSCVTNKSGVDWLKRMLSRLGIRLHVIEFDTPSDPHKPNNFHPWHIDVNLMPLRPGLCMYNPDWSPRLPEFWELFRKNDWELIPAARPSHVYRNKTYLYGEYGQTSWISMNTFSLDTQTVCVEAHETAYCEQLDKLGFKVIPIPYDRVVPFAGSLHCTTLDVYREGELEDYFPKQITSY